MERHCDKYGDNAANARAYTLLLILERFQDFLETKDARGMPIYERYNHKLRRKADHTMKWLRYALSGRHYKELKNIDETIRNGDPKTEPILQLSDFFAYVTWIRSTTNGRLSNRWYSINHKYFRLNEGWYVSGNVTI